MKFSFLVFILFFSSLLWSKGILEFPSAFNLEVARQRCSSSPTRDEAVLITANLRFRQSPEKMIENAKRLYDASERLANRAYFSSKQQKFIAPYLGQNTFVTIPSRLLESVTRHIETALRLGYVDHIIFSDMGHAHLLAPVDIYEKLRHNPFYKVLEYFYNHPRSKFIYHTAEQLDFFNEEIRLPHTNRYIQMRFYTRSLLAGNQRTGELYPIQTPKHSHNTASSWPGHRYMVGFDISANKNGCFPYLNRDNKIRYFDFSLVGHYAAP